MDTLNLKTFWEDMFFVCLISLSCSWMPLSIFSFSFSFPWPSISKSGNGVQLLNPCSSDQFDDIYIYMPLHEQTITSLCSANLCMMCTGCAHMDLLSNPVVWSLIHFLRQQTWFCHKFELSFEMIVLKTIRFLARPLKNYHFNYNIIIIKIKSNVKFLFFWCFNFRLWTI